MALDFLFAIRGLLAFISFTEFTTSGRCFLPVNLPEENGTYVQSKIFSEVDLSCEEAKKEGGQSFSEPERIVSHTFGLYCLLNGLVVLHLAIYIHYRWVVIMSVKRDQKLVDLDIAMYYRV